MPSFRFLRCAAIAVALFAGTPVLSRAQDQGSKTSGDVTNKKVDLNLENADIRYALKLLFNAVGANYSLDPAAQGSITVNLTNVPFKTALETILKSSSSRGTLTYRVEDGVYHVTIRTDSEPPLPESEPKNEPEPKKRSRVVKIDLNFIDPHDLAQIIGGTVFQSRWGTQALLFGGGFGQGGFGQGQGQGQGNQFGQSGFGGFGGMNGFGGFGQNGFGNGQGFGGNGFGGNGQGFGGNGQGFGGNGSGSGPGAGNGPGGNPGRGR